jgi:hypothetical protein
MTAKAGAEPGAEFAQRFLLARYERGGVVIDLESGNYYRVNRTAALVCDALLRTPDSTAAATSVASELGIDEQEAGRVVEQVVAGLNVPGVRGEIQGSYHFYPNDAGYELRHGENRVLDISADGARLRIAAGAPQLPASQLELYVRSLAPKLLFQSDVSVLHASSCVAAGRLIAFAGVSRAGKTTTARAFSAAGATLVSEDLVVLAPGQASSLVITDGERRVHDWAAAVTAQLVAAPDRPASTAALASATTQGPTTRLDAILFMDSSRREGREFRIAPLEEADALAELLRHDFLGASEGGAWRRFFRAAEVLLGQIDAHVMWAPAGVDGLAAAAARYISRTAS